MTARRIHVGSLPVDALRLDEALALIDRLVVDGKGGTVFTPNADHVVVGESNPRFRTAYVAADLSLVDGVSVIWASRVLGSPLPMKISGSDLVIPLLKYARDRQYRVYFLGADPGVADLAKHRIEQSLPGIQIVGVDSSRISVGESAEVVVGKIIEARPHLVLVALGAPKQEIFCQMHRQSLAPAVLLGVGASLDFVAGVKRRAPKWVSDSGFEWLFRLAQEPRRLAYRYLVRDPQFLGIVARQWWSQRRT